VHSSDEAHQEARKDILGSGVKSKNRDSEIQNPRDQEEIRVQSKLTLEEEMTLFDFMRAMDRIRFLEDKKHKGEELNNLEEFELKMLYSINIQTVEPEEE
jgi:hypothetical protein